MKANPITRRGFIKTALISATGLEIIGASPLPVAQATSSVGNPLPRWRGFNLTDFNSPNPSSSRPGTTDDDLKWMVDWGFDFIRLPMAYPRYVDFDRSKHIAPEEVYKIDEQEVDRIEAFARKAQDHGLHVSLNLHRAPGYCINAGFYEPYDLWKSKEAQAAFSFHWGMWGKRFKNVPPAKVSFDLLNEPSIRSDMNDQHAKSSLIPGDLYREVARGAVKAIRAANPDHLVIADGNKTLATWSLLN
jgi:endoglucanase